MTRQIDDPRDKIARELSMTDNLDVLAGETVWKQKIIKNQRCKESLFFIFFKYNLIYVIITYFLIILNWWFDLIFFPKKIILFYFFECDSHSFFFFLEISSISNDWFWLNLLFFNILFHDANWLFDFEKNKIRFYRNLISKNKNNQDLIEMLIIQ